MMELVLLSDDNLVCFHLWLKETVLKGERFYKCFVQDFLKIFLFVFTFLEIHGN